MYIHSCMYSMYMYKLLIAIWECRYTFACTSSEVHSGVGGKICSPLPPRIFHNENAHKYLDPECLRINLRASISKYFREGGMPPDSPSGSMLYAKLWSFSRPTIPKLKLLYESLIGASLSEPLLVASMAALSIYIYIYLDCSSIRFWNLSIYIYI